LRRDYPELNRKSWGLHIWTRGYFVGTVAIDSDVTRKYVKEQQDNQIREEPAKALEEQQRMTLSGVVVLENYRQGQW